MRLAALGVALITPWPLTKTVKTRSGQEVTLTWQPRDVLPWEQMEGLVERTTAAVTGRPRREVRRHLAR